MKFPYSVNHTRIISTQWLKIVKILSFEYIYCSLINFIVSLAFSYLHAYIMMGAEMYHTVRWCILAELSTGNPTPNHTVALEQSWAAWETIALSYNYIDCVPVIASLVIPSKGWKSHRQPSCPNWGSSVWTTNGCVGMTGCLCIHDQCKHLWCLCPFILCLELLGRRSLVPGQLDGVTTPQAAQHCSSAAVWFGVITSAWLAQHACIILCAACKVLHVMFKYSHACLCCVQHYVHNTIVILYLPGYISTPRCGHGIQWVRVCVRRSKSTAG